MIVRAEWNPVLHFTTAVSSGPTTARTSSTAASSPDTIMTGTPKYPAIAAFTPPSGIDRPLSCKSASLRLDISMDDPVLVGVLEGAADFAGDLERGVER